MYIMNVHTEREGGREGGKGRRLYEKNTIIINHLFCYYRRRNLKLKRR